MSNVILYRKQDLQFNPYGEDPGKASIARVVGPEVSKTIGAGIATFDQTSIAWTVLYDEVIVCLSGLFRLRVGDQVFEAGPGDSIWIPENTAVLYEGDAAEVFYTLYPVNWAEINSKKTI